MSDHWRRLSALLDELFDLEPAARATRLASADAGDKRMSWGCVVVPVAFYTQVVDRVLGHVRSVVYVMPETSPLQKVFRGPLL